jgi:anti-sigma factor RsiW
MKTETLEALLLDHALGELSPEVAELLETHLTHNPEAARQADGLTSTVQLAQQAMAVKQEAPRRSLSVERLRQVQMTHRRRAFIWELARLAACVVFGLTLGWYGHIARKATAAATPIPPVVAAGGLPSVPENAKDFWSLANLEAAQRERPSVEGRTNSRYRLHWDSPVKMPRVEENL